MHSDKFPNVMDALNVKASKRQRWTSLDQYDNINTFLNHFNQAKGTSARSAEFQNGRPNAATFHRIGCYFVRICPSTAVFRQAIPGPYGRTVSQAHLPDQGINGQSKTGAALTVKTPKTSQDYPELVKCSCFRMELFMPKHMFFGK